jgi:hypothetical protein
LGKQPVAPAGDRRGHGDVIARQPDHRPPAAGGSTDGAGGAGHVEVDERDGRAAGLLGGGHVEAAGAQRGDERRTQEVPQTVDDHRLRPLAHVIAPCVHK